MFRLHFPLNIFSFPRLSKCCTCVTYYCLLILRHVHVFQFASRLLVDSAATPGSFFMLVSVTNHCPFSLAQYGCKAYRPIKAHTHFSVKENVFRISIFFQNMWHCGTSVTVWCHMDMKSWAEFGFECTWEHSLLQVHIQVCCDVTWNICDLDVQWQLLLLIKGK